MSTPFHDYTTSRKKSKSAECQLIYVSNNNILKNVGHLNKVISISIEVKMYGVVNEDFMKNKIC